MDYLSIEDARAASGLRVILCAGTPGVWGEALKAVLHVKGIAYHPVAMTPGGENPELEAWTAQSSAPAVVTADNKVLTHWEQFIWLAEALEPKPALIPSDLQQRSVMFGLLQSIAGEQGLGWQRRLQSLHASGGPDAAEPLARLASRYGYEQSAVDAAGPMTAAILERLAEQLRQQQAQGSEFFVGSSLSVLDLYAAIFIGVMVQPLDDSLIPMPSGMRWAFTQAQHGVENIDPLLLDHCESIVRKYLAVPLQF